jgi:hypothetical protein
MRYYENTMGKERSGVAAAPLMSFPQSGEDLWEMYCNGKYNAGSPARAMAKR